jgi:plasmid stabilization system protein ParE
MKVIITPAAKNDIAAISDYISADNPGRAVTFAAELLESCQDLADMPRAFPLVPRYEKTEIRRRPHGRYLIFYHVDRDRIYVIHIIHAARDYERVLFPEAPD